MNKKLIVISAVNLNIGGTLTILRDCLNHLSQHAVEQNYRVVAIVYAKELAHFPNIEYIETQWPKQSWLNRLWYEYISLKKISKNLGIADLWLSLHDTTPNVIAKKQAVYCHNPFPFYDWKYREWLFAPKIVLFALFSKFIYQKNIHKNNFVIVQQQWIKDEFKHLFKLATDKIVVALPDTPKAEDSYNLNTTATSNAEINFIYASSANSHKNFECLCEASWLLEKQGISNFKVNITLTGTENPYAKWLFRKWGTKTQTLNWIGFLDREALFAYYRQSTSLIFPSKVETWGLPISEYSVFEKPMLLADLPYAHETAEGSKQTAFFDPNDPQTLAHLMKKLIEGDSSFLAPVTKKHKEEPQVDNWKDLFDLLLKEHKL